MRTCSFRLEDMTPNSKQISGVQKELQDQPTLPADALASSFTMVSQPATVACSHPNMLVWDVSSAAEHATDHVLTRVYVVTGLLGCETVQHLQGWLADHEIAAAPWKLATGIPGSQKYSGAS